jgi:SNF2 family DNA or RNA helicase
LKQATSHPFLLTRRAEDAAHPEDVVISDEELLGTRDAALLDDMKELQRALDLMGQEYVDKVAQMLEDRWKEVQKHPDGAADSDQTGTECAICFEPYEHEHAERITECCHSYCATCMENLWNDEPRTSDLTDAQLEKNMRQCPLCREPITREKVFRASAFFNPEEQADIKPQVDGEASTSAVKANGKRAVSRFVCDQRRLTDIQSEDPDEDVKPALKKLTMSKGKGRASDFSQAVEEKPKPKPADINYDELDITPSTKMRHLLAVIQEKLQDPSVKVVAYSQFTSFLDLCGAYLSANGISALMYQGSMAAGERQETLDSFNTPPDLPGGHHRVLLLSLKAGGVGLNLTVSNTVIALDLAWNAATGMSVFFYPSLS